MLTTLGLAYGRHSTDLHADGSTPIILNISVFVQLSMCVTWYLVLEVDANRMPTTVGCPRM